MSFLSPDINDKGLFRPLCDNIREKTQEDRNDITLLIVLAFIFIGLNLPRCFIGNYWLDETCTIWISHQSFEDILSNSVTYDMHPPLYYLLISATVNLFGETPFVLHFTTMIMYIGVLAICIAVIYNQFGRTAALVTMVLATFLASASYFIVEIRMYEMALVFLMASFLCFYCIVQYNRAIDWILFAVTTLIAAYTYYYCLIAIALMYLVLLVYFILKRSERKKDIIKLIVAGVISLICYIPCIIPLLRTIDRGSSFWIKYIDPLEMIEYLFSPIGVILVPLLIYLVYRTFKKNYTENPNKDGLCNILRTAKPESIWIIGGLVAVFGTIIVIIIVAIIYRPLCTAKHLFPITGIAWVLFAVCLSHVDFNPIKKYVPAIVTVCIVCASASYGLTFIDENLKWNSTQNILQHTDDYQSGDEIITDVEPLRYDGRGVLPYYYPGCSIYYTPDLKIPKLDPSVQYWIFSQNPLNDNTIRSLEEQGYKAEYRAGGSFAEQYYTNAYKIIKI